MAPRNNPIAGAGDAVFTNRSFYDGLWSQTRLTRPERFNTWPLIADLLPGAEDRLEIGPGLRPRLPIAGTHFIDISPPVIESLNACGAYAQIGDATDLPYIDGSFDLVCAFDVIEHVGDDLSAFAELSRVLKENGILIFSVPLHQDLWTPFDEMVGHVRRYDSADLVTALDRHRLIPEQSALFGMQPSNPLLLECGMWFLNNRRSSAMFWYDRVFLPLRLFFQKRLQFFPGLLDTREAAEIVLVCRRGEGEE